MASRKYTQAELAKLEDKRDMRVPFEVTEVKRFTLSVPEIEGQINAVDADIAMYGEMIEKAKEKKTMLEEKLVEVKEALLKD